jgi:hypothetical protein
MKVDDISSSCIESSRNDFVIGDIVISLRKFFSGGEPKKI